MFELRSLGGLELLRTGDGGDRAIPVQAKRLALLAYLAAQPPSTYRRRDTLLLLFWPDLDQEHARGALRQALHFLRKTLGDGAILTRGEDEIGLDPSELCSDIRALEAALAAGDAQQAISLCRGEFLEGVFVSEAAPELEDWISTERLRVRGLAARAAWMASERPANRDRVGELVRRAVQVSGDDEAALRRGLRLLDGLGDRAGAAALYDEFARRVAREFDVELSKETRDLIRALRARRDSRGIDRGMVAANPLPAADQAAPPESIAMVTPAARSGKRLLLAGVAGALVVLALAAATGLRRNAPPKARADVIAVMPFHAPAIDTSLAWLPQDIVELLTIRLVGAGTRLADPAAVIAGWQRQAASDGIFSHEAALQVASRIGASRLIEGSISGTPGRLTLSARFSSIAGAEQPVRAMVEGPADSLTQLIDRLAAQLLGMAAGMEGGRLASLTSASLPAIRVFLAGQAAFRTGRMELAITQFTEALDLDSTFALAALQLCRAAKWAGTPEQSDRGCGIARLGRDRLSPADKALLDASPAAWTSSTEGFAALHAAVSAYPERPEAWYALGDAHYHMGALSGEDGWAERASEAFKRGWLLDSALGAGTVNEVPIAEPIIHFVELAHMRHDTAEVVRLVASVLAVDSTSSLAHVLMWHRAVMTSDSAREAFWANIGSSTQRTTMEIVLFMAWTGLATEDRERARENDEARLRAHDPGYASPAFIMEALNGGRPQDVPRALAGLHVSANKLHRGMIRYAMSWDGDTAAALESARFLARSVAARAPGSEARQQLYDICTLGEWQAYRGDYRGAAVAIRHLRQMRVMPPDSGYHARYLTLCVTLLEAMHASGTHAPGAREKVATADSVARELVEEICCSTDRVGDINIQLARLWEREGDLPAAMRALARRSAMFRIGPMYMSTFIREEGRIAALMGDTATAIRAYRHYLAFRRQAQPSMRPGVDSIRATLALLEVR